MVPESCHPPKNNPTGPFLAFKNGISQTPRRLALRATSNAVGARSALERARASGWTGPALHAHEGLVCAAEGRRLDAQRLMAGVSAEDRARDPVLADVTRVTELLLARGPTPH